MQFDWQICNVSNRTRTGAKRLFFLQGFRKTDAFLLLCGGSAGLYCAMFERLWLHRSILKFLIIPESWKSWFWQKEWLPFRLPRPCREPERKTVQFSIKIFVLHPLGKGQTKRRFLYNFLLVRRSICLILLTSEWFKKCRNFYMTIREIGNRESNMCHQPLIPKQMIGQVPQQSTRQPTPQPNFHLLVFVIICVIRIIYCIGI